MIKRWHWLVWFLIVAASFAVLEYLALKTTGVTLSQTVWWASAAFPPLPFLVGLGAGILVSHFWWR